MSEYEGLRRKRPVRLDKRDTDYGRYGDITRTCSSEIHKSARSNAHSDQIGRNKEVCLAKNMTFGRSLSKVSFLSSMLM